VLDQIRTSREQIENKQRQMQVLANRQATTVRTRDNLPFLLGKKLPHLDKTDWWLQAWWNYINRHLHHCLGFFH
jgi:hypothetical protein